MNCRGWVALVAATVVLCAPGGARAGELTGLVNPFVGTEASAPDFGTGGGAGNTFPGATMPFGMVAFGPDTIPSLTNFTAGYTYSDDQIRGFSLTHFSGAGCALLQDVPILPVARSLSGSPVVAGSSDIDPSIVPTFSHRHEEARPGFYSVVLNPGKADQIRSELTATTRTAMGRFTFSKANTGTLTLNAGGSTMANYLAAVKVDPKAREVTGTSESGRFCWEPSKYKVYFAARFDRPFKGYGTWKGAALSPGSKQASDESPDAFNYKPVAGGPPFIPGNPSTTAQAGAFVSFNTSGSRPVGMRVGISFVSVAQARKNLSESAGLTFGEVRDRAGQIWRQEMGKVRVSGGRKEDRRTFATALYHSLLEPSVQSDVNGLYRGQDLKVHRVAPGHAHYSDISGWDVYRSQIQLLAMIEPRRAADIAASLLRMEKQGGCLPRWPYATQNSNVMNGDPSSPIIATIHALGVRGFDARDALRAMVKGADHPCHSDNADYTEREALDDYLDLGWISQERNVTSGQHSVSERSSPWGTASTTMEYALADFTVSRLARALGRDQLAARFLKRSGKWRNLVNPASQRIEPRFADGSFLPGANASTEDGFVEGSSAQYGWFVPQNLAGRFATLGGRKAALQKLDHFFTELNAGPGSPYAFLGNEPTLQTPWIYNWLGRPDKAQSIVRRAQIGLYGAGPGGLPGNDDGGTMSAWFVLSALGLSPVIPGTDVMPLGSPLFPRASLNLQGHRLQVRAAGADRKRPYVKSLRISGGKWAKPWIHVRRLLRGGRMNWKLSSSPSAWGRGKTLAPPSFGDR
ncbi:MAG TPA: GH92 family glycosyl hydrolase [Solirubrobacterales bacterium]|nr:GH92 family glycosyl hydrolase [Solirubrobacterales bacterium]HMU26791.1 GH92 family glycosyl hydrolase [Solirubrobacterales bacterium]HMX71382.1 GH92 family glycosyl hydrolase [Solirubrobacterales bacterium]HMY26378.1 GH92 family glycosyl hydrolase [Solirubrobacterales bacterium]HNA24199.1 GH92 family glycosyl hydrolase [Solirubrobacterales bacterium]